MLDVTGAPLPAGAGEALPGVAGSPAARPPGARRELPFLLSIALLLAVPLCFRPSPNGRAEVGAPLVYSGDEPHYLVMLNSVLDDGDLDLRNQYVAAERGGPQMGEAFRGTKLDHHVTYWVGGERVVWSQLFQPGGALRAGVHPIFSALPEYPAHPAGLSLLLAPLLLPLRGTRLVEPAALALAALAVALTLGMFARILGGLSSSRGAVRLTVVAVFLGTPLWSYARTLFTEPFAALCVMGAFWATFRAAPAYLGASAFVAAGTLMKPQLALLLVPLLAVAAARRHWAGALRLLPLPAAAVAATLLLNRHMYGSPWLGPYPYYRGELLEGGLGLLFSSRHGLLATAPVLALALAGMPRLLRQDRLRGGVVAAAFLMLYALAAAWKDWTGGYCYGPRLLVPVVPLLGIALVKALDAPLLARGPARWGAWAVVAVSVLLNLVAATHYWFSWVMSPWELLATLPALY